MYILKQKFLQKLTELYIIKRNFRRLGYGNLRHNTESQDGVLLVNSTATYFENDRILLEEAVDWEPTNVRDDSRGPVWSIMDT